MFRLLLLAYGAIIAVLVILYFLTRRAPYLALAQRLLLGGLGAGVVFFAFLLLKRLI